MPTMKVKLRPFTVPNYVMQVMGPAPKQAGILDVPKYSLAELDADTLAALCDEFRREVFTRAGKPDPGSGHTGGRENA